MTAELNWKFEAQGKNALQIRDNADISPRPAIEGTVCLMDPGNTSA